MNSCTLLEGLLEKYVSVAIADGFDAKYPYNDVALITTAITRKICNCVSCILSRRVQQLLFRGDLFTLKNQFISIFFGTCLALIPYSKKGRLKCDFKYQVGWLERVGIML